MPQLSNQNKTLTFDEHRKKLVEKYKANPNDPDPEVQKLKRQLKNTQALIESSQEKAVQSIKVATKVAFGLLNNSATTNLLKTSQNLLTETAKTYVPYLTPTNLPGSTLSSSEYRHQNLLRKIDHLEDLIQNNQTKEIKGLKGLDLFSRISTNDGRLKNHRKIAKLFLNSLKVDNFQIFRCLKPTYLPPTRKRRKTSLNDYKTDQKKNNKEIQKPFRYLRAIAKKIGYKFKFHYDYVELVPILYS